VLHTQQSITYHAQNTAQVLGYDTPDTVIQVVTPLVRQNASASMPSEVPPQ
jgi:hypothetical protein